MIGRLKPEKSKVFTKRLFLDKMKAMKVLVTGGAGYIGSITVRKLQEQGFEVVVFDNLSKGHPEAINCPLIMGDLQNREDISEALAPHRSGSGFDAVVHFAASTMVDESVKDPKRHFNNNVRSTLNLLEAMLESDIKSFVFSSSSEVYGEAEKLPLTEDVTLRPLNPYGLSKAMVEWMLPWYDNGYGLKFIALRYFNAAGAMLDGSMGEDHRPEMHLIPTAIRSALGLCDFKLTCAKMDTPDGTTIRDYTHVLDLAAAHILALEALASGHRSDVFNVGVGRGYSTLEVVKKVQEITGVEFPVGKGEPRRGEPAEKYCSNEKIRKDLGWQPKYGLEEMIESAYLWHKTHPRGYETK